MRRTFLLWLTLLLVMVFAVTGISTYVHMRSHSMERAEQLMKTRLTDMLELLHYEENSVQSVLELSKTSALNRARMAASLLKQNGKGADSSAEDLQGICNMLHADRLLLIDSAGKVQAAIPEIFKGKDALTMTDLPSLETALSDERKDYYHRPRKSSAGSMQYAGVSRRDSDGMLLLGFRTENTEEPVSTEAMTKLADHYKIGDNGLIAIFRRGALMNDSGSMPYRVEELLSVPENAIIRLDLSNGTFYAYAMADNSYRVVALMASSDTLQGGYSTLRTMMLSNLLLFIIMFVAVSYLLQRFVQKGLSRVVEGVRGIAGGDLDNRVEVNDTPEFKRLSTDINSMVENLRALGEEKRDMINRELEFARSIQSTALPSTFPAYPHISEFDFYATRVPAAKVGGDFYDFFMPIPERLNFLVAGISAHGVPAALYMMRSMALIRSSARTGARPDTMARDVNKSLCFGQTKGLNLSLFYAALNYQTGELTFVSAGSVYALLCHEGGTFEPLPCRKQSELGNDEAMSYTADRLQLQPGDRLFLYTRGVISTCNAEHESFGEPALLRALGEPATAVADIPKQVRAALRRFIGEAEPSDDITMFALEYRGRKQASGSLNLVSDKAEDTEAFLSSKLESVFAAPSDIADLHATSNAVLAALPRGTEVTLSIRCNEEDAELRFSYIGSRFNPLVGLPHLPIDRVAYTYTQTGENQLTLGKRLS